MEQETFWMRMNKLLFPFPIISITFLGELQGRNATRQSQDTGNDQISQLYVAVNSSPSTLLSPNPRVLSAIHNFPTPPPPSLVRHRLIFYVSGFCFNYLYANILHWNFLCFTPPLSPALVQKRVQRVEAWNAALEAGKVEGEIDCPPIEVNSQMPPCIADLSLTVFWKENLKSVNNLSVISSITPYWQQRTVRTSSWFFFL